MRPILFPLAGVIAFAVPRLTSAQSPSTQIPLVRGLTIVSALHFADGDRENAVRVGDISPAGVTYSWRFRERKANGDTVEESFARLVSPNDMASAPRLNPIFQRGMAREETPGYTAVSLSRASYNRVRALGEIPYTITEIDSDSSGALGAVLRGLFATRVTLKGTLSVVSKETETMPMLINARRTTVPVVHLKGKFAFQEHRLDGDYWFLADSANPIVLKVVTSKSVYQTIRIDLPEEPTTRSTLEVELERDCRAELPGIYFAFASAELQPASEPALAGVSALLGKHPSWSVAIEGHTDSIGGPMSNKKLSLDRAESVRAALVGRHGIAPARLQAAGFGATRPREPNVTLEGRARNRRVELVRECGK